MLLPSSREGYPVAITVLDDSPPAMVDWTKTEYLIQTASQVFFSTSPDTFF